MWSPHYLNACCDSFVVVTIKLDNVVPSHGRELSLKLHVNLLLIQLSIEALACWLSPTVD